MAQEIVNGDMNIWFLLQDRLTINDKWSISNELHVATGSNDW
jgi:hypothetical protein